jgi:hypothetical protein
MANKAINGKQFTIIWHADDLKISHENSSRGRDSGVTNSEKKALSQPQEVKY